MKNNPKEGPDFDSIISGLSSGKNEQNQNVGNDPEKWITKESPQVEIPIGTHGGRLWHEFLEILKDPEDEADTRRSKKLYSIDDDIVETLHQCDFGKPNVVVINCILRTFLIDNIERLRDLYRPRSASLLDKYKIQ